jgi:hypothetical protein
MRLSNNRFIVFFQNKLKQIDWKCVGAVFFAFILTRIMIVVVIYFSTNMIPANTIYTGWVYNPRNIIPNGLIRWDSPLYIDIAQNGYSLANLRNTAFFPLYPILIRLASLFTGNSITSGLWVSNIMFLIALFYLYAITKTEFDEGTAGRAVFYIASAPTAFFFSAVYTESAFLLFLTVCFFYSVKGKWFLAAVAGALASATRVPGILCAVFIFFEALWQQGVRFIPKPWNLRAQINILKDDLPKLPKAWRGILASIFSLSGIMAYMVYLYQKFGNALTFVQVQSGWNRSMSLDWISKLIQNIQAMHKVGNIFAGEIGTFWYLIDTLTIIVFLPLVILTFLKFRPSFGLFALLSFLIPISTGNSLSMQRFVLVIIPFFFLLAKWGKKPWVDRLIIGISLPLQAYFLVLFSHRFWAG